jgi:hypothetical protein
LTWIFRPLPLLGTAVSSGVSGSSSLTSETRRAAAGSGGLRRRADVAELDEGDDRDDDEDQRGADGPADLQARVAADLGRHGALARAELEEGVDEGALDGDEHDDAQREQQLEQAVDVVGVGGAAVLGREEVGRGAPLNASDASSARSSAIRKVRTGGRKAAVMIVRVPSSTRPRVRFGRMPATGP